MMMMLHWVMMMITWWWWWWCTGWWWWSHDDAVAALADDGWWCCSSWSRRGRDTWCSSGWQQTTSSSSWFSRRGRMTACRPRMMPWSSTTGAFDCLFKLCRAHSSKHTRHWAYHSHNWMSTFSLVTVNFGLTVELLLEKGYTPKFCVFCIVRLAFL